MRRPIVLQLNRLIHLLLKGGTAINLTVFDLPRLSVDIDMDFVPNLPREDITGCARPRNLLRTAWKSGRARRNKTHALLHG